MIHRKNHTHPSHDRWLISYADFITLLLAFFVVLYASSHTDQKKQEQFATAIQSSFKALGIFPGKAAGSSSISIPQEKTDPNAMKALAGIESDLTHKLAGQIADHAIAMTLSRDGLVISLREAGFYKSGVANPLPQSIPTIAIIAQELYGVPYALRIEGHTDNVPIHTSAFASNWELSTARATQMARLLINHFGIAPERLSAAGYAQYHPIASNATAAGRAENRRVDIIVLPDTYVANNFGPATAPSAGVASPVAKSASATSTPSSTHSSTHSKNDATHHAATANKMHALVPDHPHTDRTH